MQHVTSQDMSTSEEVQKRIKEYDITLHNVVRDENCVSSNDEFYNFINKDPPNPYMPQDCQI